MPKRRTEAPCAACGSVCPSSKLSRVVIDGRTVLCCRSHAAMVAARMPRTFEDLRRMFLEEATEAHPGRRSVVERRNDDDRRVFPPRPEGRRMASGRRSGDVAA